MFSKVIIFRMCKFSELKLMTDLNLDILFLFLFYFFFGSNPHEVIVFALWEVIGVVVAPMITTSPL
jgi:hypothetical protein